MSDTYQEEYLDEVHRMNTERTGETCPDCFRDDASVYRTWKLGGSFVVTCWRCFNCGCQFGHNQDEAIAAVMNAFDERDAQYEASRYSPWNDPTLDEWRCDLCASVVFVPVRGRFPVLKCPYCSRSSDSDVIYMHRLEKVG